VKTDATGTAQFLFNVRDPEQTLRASAEAAMREVIGRNDIDAALTEDKERIQTDAQTLLQTILDHYGIGVEVVTVKLRDVDPPDQVSDAFKDVISAQQDKERLINESLGGRVERVAARGKNAATRVGPRGSAGTVGGSMAIASSMRLVPVCTGWRNPDSYARGLTHVVLRGPSTRCSRWELDEVRRAPRPFRWRSSFPFPDPFRVMSTRSTRSVLSRRRRTTSSPLIFPGNPTSRSTTSGANACNASSAAGPSRMILTV
jgi:SPFH domain / Band 7 family